MKSKVTVENIIEKYELQILIGLLLLSCSVHIYSTFGGLIWSSDSFHYWAASRSFQSDKIFLTLEGGDYTYWPPLFPIILSFFSEQAYYVIHTLCFISSLLFIYLFFKKITSKNLAVISLAIFITSIYPYLISSFLWAENIFIFLLFSGLYFYENWIQDKQKIYNLIISSVLLSFMCLQRHAGVFIIIGLSVYCFTIFLREKNWKFLFKTALIHLLIVLPNIIWNASQKIYSTNHYHISKRPFFSDFFLSLDSFSVEFTKFLIPFTENSIVANILFVGIIIAISTLIQRSINSYILIAYILLYSFLPKFESSEIGRFLTPVFPIIILQLVLLSKEAFSKFHSRKIKLLITAVLALIILYNIARTAKNVSQWNYRSIHHPKSAKIFF